MVGAFARHIGKSPGLSDWEAVKAYMLLTQMREYWRIYRPAVFLFERSVSGGPLSVRTAQAIFQHAKAASGIQKKPAGNKCPIAPFHPTKVKCNTRPLGSATRNALLQVSDLSVRWDIRPPLAHRLPTLHQAKRTGTQQFSLCLFIHPSSADNSNVSRHPLLEPRAPKLIGRGIPGLGFAVFWGLGESCRDVFFGGVFGLGFLQSLGGQGEIC